MKIKTVSFFLCIIIVYAFLTACGNPDSDAKLTSSEIQRTSESHFVTFKDELFRKIVMDELGIISENQLTSQAVANITNLVIDGALFSRELTDLSGIESLINLKKLCIYNVPIIEIEALKGLLNLRELELYSCKDILSYDPLASLVNLEYLSLDRCSFSDISTIQSLRCLRFLDISRTKVEDISGLRNLTRLKTLRMGGDNIRSMQGLENLVDLTTLDMPNTIVYDADAGAIFNLPHLNHINLVNTNISENQIRAIRSNFPQAQVYYSLGSW